MNKKPIKLDKICFLISTVFLSLVVGFTLATLKQFPYPQLQRLQRTVRPWADEMMGKTPWYYIKSRTNPEDLRRSTQETAQSDLTLITRLSDNKHVDALVINGNGETIHQWDLDIFRHWPSPDNAPPYNWPKQLPGALIHGAVVQENGDLIFNYTLFGLMRVDICAEPVWKLKGYITHHSVQENENGDMWVSGRLIHDQKPLDWLPNHQPPFKEEFALKVSPQGKLLEAISIPRILQENGYHGLLYLSSKMDMPLVSGDMMHLNDVEEFPQSMTPGTFGPGDIMVSLRNMSTVFVFNKTTRKIKYISTGEVFRQHDPDFVDGDHISIFNNDIISDDPSKESSKIVIFSVKDNTKKIVFPTAGETLFSRTQGKHQWLPNGNLLITEARNGRAIEIDVEGNVVWEYINYLANGNVGIILEATRLDKRFSAKTFTELAKNCR